MSPPSALLQGNLAPYSQQLSDPHGIDIAIRLLDHRLDRIQSFSRYLLDTDNNEQDRQTFCSCEAYVLLGEGKPEEIKQSIWECGKWGVKIQEPSL